MGGFGHPFFFAGRLRSVVAASAEELGFAHCLEGRCLQRLRPTGRKDAEPPIDDQPCEGAASSSPPGSRRFRAGCYDGA